MDMKEFKGHFLFPSLNAKLPTLDQVTTKDTAKLSQLNTFYHAALYSLHLWGL